MRKIKYFVARRKFQQVGQFILVKFKFWSSSNLDFDQIKLCLYSSHLWVLFWCLSGSEAVRCSRRDRAVLAGPPQHDGGGWWLMSYKFSLEAFICLICLIRQPCYPGENQGAAEAVGPDLGQTWNLPSWGWGPINFQIKEHTIIINYYKLLPSGGQ